MTMLMSATTILTGASVLLLVGLLVIYLRNVRHVRSKLVVGLILFVVLLLIQNVVSLYYYVTMMPYYVVAVEPHMFIFSMLQTIAFSVMLWISWD